MIYVLGAIAVALVYNCVSLAVTHGIQAASYPDISLLCRRIGEIYSACTAGALEAGYTMVVGIGLSLVLSVIAGRRFDKTVNTASFERVFPAAASIVCVLAGFHIAQDLLGVRYVTRLQQIHHAAIVISLENLVWPLLLQFAVSTRSLQVRIQYFALFLLLASLSPFRGVFFAGLAFGLGLPILQAMLARMGSAPGSQHRSLLPRYILAAGCVALLGSYGLYYQTKERASDLDTATVAEAGSAFAAKVAQRLSYPLYQAYTAKTLAETSELPTGWDEVLRKFRLSPKPNLNEHLVHVIYGEGTSGEATSLLYGEAAANSLSSPFIWVALAPLSFVLLWLALRRLGIETGVIVGIAIWRGSLGGAFTVLPALALQIAALVILQRLLRDTAHLSSISPESAGQTK